MTKYDAMQGILRSSGHETLDRAADCIEELVSIIKMLTSGCESCDFGKISIDAMSRKADNGRVYDKPISAKQLRQGMHSKGYKVVTLTKDGVSKTHFVHRLVPEATLPDAPEVEGC